MLSRLFGLLERMSPFCLFRDPDLYRFSHYPRIYQMVKISLLVEHIGPQITIAHVIPRVRFCFTQKRKCRLFQYWKNGGRAELEYDPTPSITVILLIGLCYSNLLLSLSLPLTNYFPVSFNVWKDQADILRLVCEQHEDEYNLISHVACSEYGNEILRRNNVFHSWCDFVRHAPLRSFTKETWPNCIIAGTRRLSANCSHALIIIFDQPSAIIVSVYPILYI